MDRHSLKTVKKVFEKEKDNYKGQALFKNT
jgi:hypothetical protein